MAPKSGKGDVEFELHYEFKFNKGEKAIYDLIENTHGFMKLIHMHDGVIVYSHKSGALLAVHTIEPTLVNPLYRGHIDSYHGTQMEIAGANFTERRSLFLQASLDQQVSSLIEAKNPSGFSDL